MEVTFEAAVIEEAVCSSQEKELRLHCNAASGRGWVEVAGRRFVGRGYVQAAHKLHAENKLHVKHASEQTTTYELGHHVCAKAQAR